MLVQGQEISCPRVASGTGLLGLTQKQRIVVRTAQHRVLVVLAVIAFLLPAGGSPSSGYWLQADPLSCSAHQHAQHRAADCPSQYCLRVWCGVVCSGFGATYRISAHQSSVNNWWLPEDRPHHCLSSAPMTALPDSCTEPNTFQVSHTHRSPSKCQPAGSSVRLGLHARTVSLCAARHS